jgi:uncharacterized delta-60 repeat protein
MQTVALDNATSVAVNSDDSKIAVVGSPSFSVALLNSSGSLDTGFSTDGIVTTVVGSGDLAEGVTFQSDGKIVAGGYSFSGVFYRMVAARYNTDGSLDTTFDTDGIALTSSGSNNTIGREVTLQAYDQKIIVVGEISNGSNDDFGMARFNTNGSLDTTFGSSGLVITTVGSSTDVGRDAVCGADGRIHVTGQVTAATFDVGVTSYNSDGTLNAQ